MTMPAFGTELAVLAWGCVLALVYILAPAQARTAAYGYKWNMGPRDDTPKEESPLIGRLSRAQANFFETFPLVIAAILAVTVGGLTNKWTAMGAIIWLVARIIYLPLYAAGIPAIRSLAYLVSIAGLMIILWPALGAGWNVLF